MVFLPKFHGLKTVTKETNQKNKEETGRYIIDRWEEKIMMSSSIKCKLRNKAILCEMSDGFQKHQD